MVVSITSISYYKLVTKISNHLPSTPLGEEGNIIIIILKLSIVIEDNFYKKIQVGVRLTYEGWFFIHFNRLSITLINDE